MSWYMLTDSLNEQGVVSYYATGSSDWDNAGYPVSGCVELTRPLRETRSDNPVATTPILAVDLGSDVSVQAVTIERCNNYLWSSLQYDQAALDGWTTFPSASVLGTTKATAIDPLDGRVKMIVLESSPVTARYIRNSFSSATQHSDDDPGYIYVGSLGVWESATLLTKNWGLPMRETLAQAVTVRKFDSGGSIVSQPSEPYVGFQIETKLHTSNTTAISEFGAIARYPKNKVACLYKNDSDTKEMYHVKRIATSIFQEDTNMYVRYQVRFEEVY